MGEVMDEPLAWTFQPAGQNKGRCYLWRTASAAHCTCILAACQPSSQ
jgi:hypothetical protein